MLYCFIKPHCCDLFCRHTAFIGSRYDSFGAVDARFSFDSSADDNAALSVLSAKPRNSRRQLSVVCLIIRAAFSGQDNIGIAYLFLKPDKRSKRRKSGSKLAAEVKSDSGAETACRTASRTHGDIVSASTAALSAPFCGA